MSSLPVEDIIRAVVSFLIGGLLGRELYRVIDKPSVRIEYRQPLAFNQEDGQFLSVRVGNIGRNSAEKCWCTLTIFNLDPCMIMAPAEAETYENLHEYKEENLDLDYPRYQLVQPESQRPIANEPLCWATLGNPAQVEINPGTTQALDLCKLFRSDGKEYFIFPTEFGWRRVRTRIRAKGKLRCRILVCPANDYPTPLDFELYAIEGKVKLHTIRPSLFTRFRRLFFKNYLYTK